MSWTTPANFIPHADHLESQNSLSEAIWPDHALDMFRAEGSEWLVTLCNDDQLRRIPVDFAMPREIKNELACHRVSCPQVRTLGFKEYYLMDVRTLDCEEGEKHQRMARLSGTLYTLDGAYGAGELVLRVSELLYALCQAALNPFRYAQGAFYPLALPGDTEENLRQGKGLILAYAVPPVEIRGMGFSNEDWTKQAFFDCLNTIQADLKEDKPKAPLSLMTLPVPSRAMLIAELKQQGYQILQDKAIATARTNTWAGRMLKVFGSLTGQGLTLPPEADVAAYAKIGRDTLQSVFEPVPFRMKALMAFNAVKTPGNSPPLTPTPPAAPNVPRATAPPPEPPPPTPQLPRQPVQDWMSDFAGGPTAPTHRPKNPTPTPPPKPAKAPPSKPSPSKPDWAKDFE